MKPYCIPTHCPFCERELTFYDRREGQEGINPLATHLCCSNCQFRHPDGGYVCFQISFHDGSLDYILILSPYSLLYLSMHFNPRREHKIFSVFGKVYFEEDGSPSKDWITDFDYLVPVDLCSKENIETKLKLLATYL